MSPRYGLDRVRRTGMVEVREVIILHLFTCLLVCPLLAHISSAWLEVPVRWSWQYGVGDNGKNSHHYLKAFVGLTTNNPNKSSGSSSFGHAQLRSTQATMSRETRTSSPRYGLGWVDDQRPTPTPNPNHPTHQCGQPPRPPASPTRRAPRPTPRPLSPMLSLCIRIHVGNVLAYEGQATPYLDMCVASIAGGGYLGTLGNGGRTEDGLGLG